MCILCMMTKLSTVSSFRVIQCIYNCDILFGFFTIAILGFFCRDNYKPFYSAPAGGNSLIAASSFSKKNKPKKKSSHECIRLLQPKENTIKQLPNSSFFL